MIWVEDWLDTVCCDFFASTHFLVIPVILDTRMQFGAVVIFGPAAGSLRAQ
jgi:hypothetical protein